MERAPDINERMIEVALEYLRLGYRPIPLRPGSKAAEVKWKPYQLRSPTKDEVVGFFAAGEPNVALVTGNGVVVVDVDDPALLDVVLENCGDTPQRTLTPRGGHHLWYGMRRGVHYGNSVKIKGKPLDLRCEGAYAVVPWSKNTGGMAYRWAGPVLPAADLPLIKISWLRERKRPQSLSEPVDPGADIGLLIRRARSYLATIEGAVSGQGGHNQTFRSACILCVRFGLSFEQAWPLLKEWSETSCEPPWSDKELEHKLRDALKKRGRNGSREP